jgi:phosphatidylserine decarboxylase
MVLVFRLAPCDYHRFGHVADGVQGAVHSVNGRFHSVNPLATRHKPDVLMTNYRQWCLVQSPLWGTILYLEVGAMMVGSIVQHRPNGGPCFRGQEKGYFQFGGSTVVVVVEPDRITMDADILDHSRRGIETLVRYGEGVGTHTR